MYRGLDVGIVLEYEKYDSERHYVCHPMLHPLILCEMLMKANSNSIKLNATKLSEMEMRTNISSLHDLEQSRLTNLGKVILSMNMFHWQAAPGERVATSLF